ncbi:mitochondria fission 1 protein [Spathaspora passalidarum NRRL Y-27907]|uniref:Mitochondrial fission 1 protein n=1 Tax=Spathaspora passalidarum (strain NRRL Y-27907 / 11-Y1) TaxID=619300 RepID=G3AVP6_SPAPN|nr:mitochondria fission 1 protein [Spathaspora passalidarum NRRL Y-27907]EGW30213.1 mitochondria fission 1 protein [Spathaspora passalidarum NRRL Y-27907]
MSDSPIYQPLEELKQPLSQEQLQILKDQLRSEEPNPSPQTKFNYAWGLIKSPHYKQQQDGVAILVELYKSEEGMRREVLYYLSLGSFKVGDYTNAKRYIEALLYSEPDNQQAQALLQTIDDRITTDGLIGIGIVGGALAIGVGLIGALVRRKRK